MLDKPISNVPCGLGSFVIVSSFDTSTGLIGQGSDWSGLIKLRIALICTPYVILLQQPGRITKYFENLYLGSVA